MPSFNGFHKNKSGRINIPDVNTHILDLAPHGATALATANKIVLRDANGNTAFNYPVSGQNPNLLFNPSFRLGSAGWTGIGLNGFNVVTGTLGEGAFLRTQSSAVGSVSVLSAPTIPVDAGVNVSFSAEIYTGGITAGSAITSLLFYNATSSIIGRIDLNLANGSAWTKVSGTAVTPAGTVSMVVQLSLAANTTNLITAWRKIKIEASSVATTFSDDNTLNTVQYGGVLPLAQVLSGGNKVQSGLGSISVATAGTAVSQTITFPVAFGVVTMPNVVVGLAGSSLTAGYNNILVTSLGNTSFTISANSYVSQTLGFYWIATGN